MSGFDVASERTTFDEVIISVAAPVRILGNTLIYRI